MTSQNTSEQPAPGAENALVVLQSQVDEARLRSILEQEKQRQARARRTNKPWHPVTLGRFVALGVGTALAAIGLVDLAVVDVPGVTGGFGEGDGRDTLLLALTLLGGGGLLGGNGSPIRADEP